MREILFRGKRIDNGEWVEGFLWKKKYNTNKIFISCFPDKDDNEEVFVVRPETIGQYTGLTYNGNKIFEGDIISIPFEEDRSPCEENCVYYENAKVYFDNEHYGWYVKFFDGEALSIWEYDEIDIVVIGNIHDNPELLKEREHSDK